MNRSKLPVLLGFVSGMAVTVVLVAVAGSLGNIATANRYEDLSVFTNVLNLVRQNYVEPVDERKLLRGAVRGMLQELDPHSSFMEEHEYKEMQIDTRGEFHGLGIEISKRKDGFIEVIAPIEGTPAQRSGIRSRDQIVEICPTDVPEDWTEECRNTKHLTLFEAVRLMRGPRGSKITIRIYREGFDRPQPYTLVRDVVKVVSVAGRMLEPGYAYVRVRSFQERTDKDLAKTLETLNRESTDGFKGLVLDLRDNPGGLLDQAVKVADRWLTEGLVVYTKGRVESQRHEFRAHPERAQTSYPMVVLVNSGSASASEIVAGALQDHHRALVLGTKTFGKGSVQTIYPQEDGTALRLTTALYYTPGGRSIQEVGIDPDITVETPSNGAGPAGEMPPRLRERDLEGHFSHEQTDPAKLRDSAAPGPNEPQATDLQLSRALEVLKSWSYFERLTDVKRAGVMPAEVTEATP